jgi:hypothetical protein
MERLKNKLNLASYTAIIFMITTKQRIERKNLWQNETP